MSSYTQKLQNWLAEKDAKAEMIRFEQSVHTVEEAVEVSGHPVERFTKSIVMVSPDDKLVIAMVPAECRASTERVKKVLSLPDRPRLASNEETEARLGQSVGGNSPLNAGDATVLIDPKVLEKDWILTGGGDDRSLVKISIEELKGLVSFQKARVRK